ncbi:MAG: hypothetical protein QMD22_09825, partial [archaeon]|nr:hypothetical protein [archaeon]
MRPIHAKILRLLGGQLLSSLARLTKKEKLWIEESGSTPILVVTRNVKTPDQMFVNMEQTHIIVVTRLNRAGEHCEEVTVNSYHRCYSTTMQCYYAS